MGDSVYGGIYLSYAVSRSYLSIANTTKLPPCSELYIIDALSSCPHIPIVTKPNVQHLACTTLETPLTGAIVYIRICHHPDIMATTTILAYEQLIHQLQTRQLQT